MSSAIANGADVELFGLNAAYLNGAKGRCLRIDAPTGRYVVQLKEPAAAVAKHPDPIKVKRENLKESPDGPHSRNSTLAPSAWANGLSKDAAAEWLVDCYRMRLDDEYVMCGDGCGLYNPGASAASITVHFLEFCLLAAAAGVVPPGWDWRLCLARAGQLLCFAFEKSDAAEKYGGENIFMAAMGGRSLRFTAVQVYGRGPEMMAAWEAGGQERCAAIDELLEPLQYPESDSEFLKVAWDHTGVFKRVGDLHAWRALHAAVRAELCKQRPGYEFEFDDDDFSDDASPRAAGAKKKKKSKKKSAHRRR